MPIYMDRHDLPGVTAEDVAEAHQEDLKIQEKYGCRSLTYWFDEKRGTAFCLIEAPDKNSVKEMHDHAHGLIPHQLIEVDSNVVEAFLGRIEDPEISDNHSGSDLAVVNDPAFRTIMVTDLKDSALLNSKCGRTEATELFRKYDDLVREKLNQHNGREVESSEAGFMASFASVSRSVVCAIEIQKSFKRYNSKTSAHKMHVQIGLNAGVPVTESDLFFGPTVRFAKRLCDIANEGQLIVSSTVREFYKGEELDSIASGDTIKMLSPKDEELLNNLVDIAEKFWNEEEFTVDNFAKQLGVSKSQLYRKIISLTGYSPNDFIKEFRLHKALKLIEKQRGNISEVAYEAGFNSPSYFSKCFKNRFEILPSDYATSIAHPLSS